MSILHWFEDQIDKLAPIVQVHGRSKVTYSKEQFAALIKMMAAQPSLSVRSSSASECVLCVAGATVGDLEQAKVVLGEEATPDKYKGMKSRLRLVLTGDGTLEMTSFEHMAGLEEEKVAFRVVLGERLEFYLQMAS